jgi:hypothetical protein
LVALCLEHAHKADAGAFTDDQVREMKRSGGERAQSIEGEFDWRRKQVLVIVGGNFYLRTNVILELGGIPFISLSRDPEGYVLLNFTMPTVSGEPRAQVFDNFWTVPPGVNDFDCPPSGRSIRAWYGNGDELRMEFFHAGGRFCSARVAEPGRHAGLRSTPSTSSEAHSLRLNILRRAA